VSQSLPPGAITDAVRALRAVQDAGLATPDDHARDAARQRSELETVLAALLRSGILATADVTASDSRPAANRLINRQQVGELFGLRRSAAYDLTQRLDFPPPVVISPRCLRWPLDEVLAFAEKLRHDGTGQQPCRVHATRAGGYRAQPAAGGRITGQVRPARRAQAHQ
jgi:predicted DNA-binding transcriptional regulator AlpA